jgi:hypothetical protein
MNPLTKPCEERDSDILMLVHRNLEPLAALDLHSHLWQCERCRRRRAEFAALTMTLTSATCPAHAADNGLESAGFSISSSTIVVSALILTILVSLVAAILPWLPTQQLPSSLRRPPLTSAYRPSSNAQGGHENAQSAGPVSGQTPDDGCIPGLPSDRCR